MAFSRIIKESDGDLLLKESDGDAILLETSDDPPNSINADALAQEGHAMTLGLGLGLASRK